MPKRWRNAEESRFSSFSWQSGVVFLRFAPRQERPLKPFRALTLSIPKLLCGIPAVVTRWGHPEVAGLYVGFSQGIGVDCSFCSCQSVLFVPVLDPRGRSILASQVKMQAVEDPALVFTGVKLLLQLY